MTIPWLPFFLFGCRDLLVSLVSKIRSAGPNPQPSNDASKTLTAYCVGVAVISPNFFSSGSKLPGYILPSVPSAVLIGLAADIQVFRSEPKTIPINTSAAIATLRHGCHRFDLFCS